MTETDLAIAATKRLRDITLRVETTLGAGVTALVGPSGSGKTTLLRLIAGLTYPDTGTIRLGLTVLDDAERRYHLPPGQRNISLVFQEYALFPHLSVAENVAYGLHARRVARHERRRRVAAMLERLSITTLAGERPAQLSGGQRQRVALARALVLQPRALLLDEPLAALDVQTRAAVRRELHAMLSGLAIPTILVTHDYADALTFRERILIMAAGEIVHDGTHETLLAHPRSRFVADFTGINFYEGTLERYEPGHLARVQVADGVELYVSVEEMAPGPISVALRPWEVIVSAEPPHGSARNVLACTVHEVLPLGGRIRLVLGAGLRHTLPLVAEITPEALAGLDCNEGQMLYASFKATALSVNAL